MSVRIELFGIARERAGLALIEGEAKPLGNALGAARARRPGLLASTTASGELRWTFMASLNGRRFILRPETPVADGDSILLLSADAGG